MARRLARETLLLHKALFDSLRTEKVGPALDGFRNLLQALFKEVDRAAACGLLDPDRAALARELLEVMLEIVGLLKEVLPPDAVGLMLDVLQLIVDVLGLIPAFGIIADAVNAIISAARRQWLDVGISILAAIPLVGLLAGPGKVGKKIGRLVAKFSGLAKAAKAAKAANRAGKLKKLVALLRLLGDAAGALAKGPRAAVRKLREGLDAIRRKFGRNVDEAADGADPKFWTKSKTFDGNRVFQRDDLIDPKLIDARGRTNLERMQNGLAPLGPDGKPINLHHLIQTQDGAIAEVTQTVHQQNFGTLHINPNTIPSGIDRKAFNSWKRKYWMDRANDFGGSP